MEINWQERALAAETMLNAAILDLAKIAELVGADENDTAPFCIPEILESLKVAEFEREQFKDDLRIANSAVKQMQELLDDYADETAELKAKLAEIEKQEPVAQIIKTVDGFNIAIEQASAKGLDSLAQGAYVYASPVQQSPVSEPSIAPIVEWMSPESIPYVKLYSERQCWIACINGKGKKYVYLAQYVNRPIILNDEGDPENDDYFSNTDGEPMHAVGWHSEKEHFDYDGFYEQIQFSDDYKLIGWAEYVAPLPPQDNGNE